MPSDVAIQNIVFHPDGAFDISYAEQRDINPKGIIVRQLMMPGDVIPDSVMDQVRETLQDLLDIALEARNDDPATRISRR